MHAQTAARRVRSFWNSQHEGIAVLVLNRPEKLNALNSELSTALNDALTRIADDDSIHVVVLSGAGRAFCAGGDLAAIGKGRERKRDRRAWADSALGNAGRAENAAHAAAGDRGCERSRSGRGNEHRACGGHPHRRGYRIRSERISRVLDSFRITAGLFFFRSWSGHRWLPKCFTPGR